MKRVIATTEAPAAVGPYSQAIAVGDLLFCAGQIPLDPVTGDLVGTDEDQQLLAELDLVPQPPRAACLAHSAAS